MKVKFEIKVTRGTMYNFMMYHAYHGFSGIFSIVAGLALIVYFAWQVSQGGANSWMYLLFGVLFLVYQPWTLFMHATKQVGMNPVFKKPLAYVVSEEGITVKQGDTENHVPWEGVQKVRETKESIFIYTSQRNAFIWTKNQMTKQEAAVRKLLQEHVAQAKQKGAKA